jgi:hypothetical protein
LTYESFGWPQTIAAAIACGLFASVALRAVVDLQFIGALLLTGLAVLSSILLARYVRRRYEVGAIRDVRVDLNTTTPLLGDAIVVRVQAEGPARSPLVAAVARLRCICHMRSGSERERRQVLREVVRQAEDLDQGPEAGRGELLLPIPDDAPPSLLIEDNAVRWHLDIGLRLRDKRMCWLEPLEVVVRPIMLVHGGENEREVPQSVLQESDEGGSTRGSFQLRLNHRRVRPGEEAEGLVMFVSGQDIDEAVMTARLAFSADGLGNPRNEQLALTTVYTGPVHKDQRVDGTFALRVPVEGPISLESEFVSVRWEVQLAIAESGPGTDSEIAHASFPIEVRPTAPLVPQNG